MSHELIQLLATILFFTVFIEAFIVLTIYIGTTLYRFWKATRDKE
jgi:hypothetical protein